MNFFKSWPYSLLLILGVFVAVTACKNDDEPDPVLSITAIEPLTAPVGGTVTIAGTQFSATPASNTVTFGGNVQATVTSATETQLVVTVPAGAQNGPITVKTGTQTATSTQSFTLGNKPVEEVSGQITANATWSSSKVYLIKGFVYVRSGATLTIQPGTIIKGGTPAQDPSGQQKGGTLIVQPGGKIEAKGTAQQPIIFTSGKAPGQRGYGDWGGIVLIGKAPHNQAGTRSFEGGIEGTYGTSNEPADNSGTLQYVRIEFGGIALSNASNSEINGLTLYGVGSGTTIDHVQVSYSGDDSYEWFGGTVNAKYLVAHRGFDDDFDTDHGFTGKIQFAVSLRDPEVADQSTSNGFESDNFDPGEPATGANVGLPLTAPVFSNVSIFNFSAAPNGNPSPKGSGPYGRAMHLRRNTAISIYNSVFVGYPEGLRLDGTATGTLANATGDKLDLRGNVLANMLKPVAGAGAVTDALAQTYFNDAARKNQTVAAADLATQLLNAATFNLTAPNFLPQGTSPLLTGAVKDGKVADAFFEKVDYKGAFGTTNWLQGWTNFDPQNTDYDK
ncbi:IPT/TIG domain-containing protein [Larkinella soli]|uniref:IPT/TIG domain-containing protein n=1 Tax=Larkinella soli TaxID=1770527 RepID=UPI000FFC2364|nr:IPT/TIG domain-containing protein [Larkinella soli]